MWAWVAEGGGWVLHGGVGGICHRRFDEIVKINERIPAPRKCRGLLFFSRPPVDDFHPLEGDAGLRNYASREMESVKVAFALVSPSIMGKERGISSRKFGCNSSVYP